MLELREVTFRYDEDAAPVLDHVDLRLDEGELVLVAGRTGVGKSTLLGLFNGLVPTFTGGHLTGDVLLDGASIVRLPPRDRAHVVGYVGQDPSAGFVTDTVEEELAYGMEQLGIEPATMRRRVEETLDLLGIAELRGRDLRTLSGGQQQRVAAGAVLTMHPRLLVLDEPTSALDPTAAEDVLATLTRLVQDVGTTVVVAEHRLERVVPFADRMVVVEDDGRLVVGAPAEVLEKSPVAPPIVELGRWAQWRPLPLTVREARRKASTLQLAEAVVVGAAGPANVVEEAAVRPSSPVRDIRRSGGHPGRRRPAPERGRSETLRARGLRVAYGRRVAVRDVDLVLPAGSVTAVMGRNGSGKSTLLWALQGSRERAAGTVSVGGTDPAAVGQTARRGLVGMVPQTAADLLYLETVAEELATADRDAGGPAGGASALLDRLAPGVDRSQHPRDLSEGQRLALVLAIVLTSSPEVLLLDEPTRGLDYPGKAALAGMLRDLRAEGRAVLVATHDVEFVAQVADRVVVLAGGEVVSSGPTTRVVAESPAFAPQVHKILGGEWLTVEQVVAAG